MTRKNAWPREAKLTIVGLAILILVIAAIRAPNDHGKQTAPVRVSISTITSAIAPVPTTKPPTSHPSPTSPLAGTIAPPGTTVPLPPMTQPAPALALQPVAAVLDGLPVTTPDLSHPYKRTEDFGTAWTDDNNMADGHNGCDTRNDILHRDLTNIQVRPGTRDCVVIAGTFVDPYSGTTMTFTKAQASLIQIDHIVPLHAAWELGAWQWPQSKRVDYANDPDVLTASNGRLNEQKGDKLADEWKPPNTSYWCTYATRTVDIHAKYALPVTSPERTALHKMLTTCH